MIHPEIAEHVNLPSFTHWLLLPETTDYYAFLKAVTLDRHSDLNRMRDRGIRIFPIGARPEGYPIRPEYKFAAGRKIRYQGVVYTIRAVTEDAIAVGSTGQQILWAKKSELRHVQFV